MQLVNLIPDAEVVIALEPDELGVRMLPVLAQWSKHSRLEFRNFLGTVIERYSPAYHSELTDALSEAWAWLEGGGSARP